MYHPVDPPGVNAKPKSRGGEDDAELAVRVGELLQRPSLNIRVGVAVEHAYAGISEDLIVTVGVLGLASKQSLEVVKCFLEYFQISEEDDGPSDQHVHPNNL